MAAFYACPFVRRPFMQWLGEIRIPCSKRWLAFPFGYSPVDAPFAKERIGLSLLLCNKGQR